MKKTDDAAFEPVLPDGVSSNQKSQFGLILKGLATEDIGIFMAILSTNFTDKWYFCGHLLHF
jgi:hypothetical protein